MSQSVSDGFDGSRDLIGVESGKQLDEIRALSQSVSDGFDGSRDLINGKFIDIVDSIKGNHDEFRHQIADLLNDNYVKFNNDFKHSFEIFNNHYKNCREYFFNGNENLLKKNLDTDFLFNFCYFNNIDLISYSPEENTLLLKTNEGIILSTNNHVYTIMELYGLNEYMIPILYKFDDFVVFDIGMNRGYATLKFANFDNCSAVYGFEIDQLTYSKALDNISLNPHLSDKITTFNFGLSDIDEIVDLYYYDGFDGLNTMMHDFLESSSALRHYKDKVDVKKVEVKKVSKIIREILLEGDIKSKIVLKVDTEGAEYKIIGDLIYSGLIEKIDVIVGEGHIFSNNDFKEDLLNLGFKIVKFDMDEATYDFAFVKEEHFNYWPLFVS